MSSGAAPHHSSTPAEPRLLETNQSLMKDSPRHLLLLLVTWKTESIGVPLGPGGPQGAAERKVWPEGQGQWQGQGCNGGQESGWIISFMASNPSGQRGAWVGGVPTQESQGQVLLLALGVA